MDTEQILIKLQETTDRSNRNEGRIKKLEHESEVLHQLATSVAVMAEQMKGVNQKVTTIADEVEEIKSKPAKRWDSIVEKILTVVIAALVGYVLARLGLG